MNDAEWVDYARTLDCIHCGLCLRTCPTYRLTGRETSSPRGRIALMRAVAEERLDPRTPEYGEELDFCLVCRHCESVCPAGVRFGEMMEHARAARETLIRRPAALRFLRWMGLRSTLDSRFLLARAHDGLRFAQRSGLIDAAAKLAGPRGKGLRFAPQIAPANERALLPQRSPAQGTRRGQVAMLEGCVMPELYPEVNRATARVLTGIGYDVITARAATCCGALAAHNGELDTARELGKRLIEAFETTATADETAAPIVVNSAGCGAHMKELARFFEGDLTWHYRATRFAERVVDFSEFVAPRLDATQRLSFARADAPWRATYDDPCHLCHGQGVRKQPREILDRIEGLRRVEMASSEACCGSAGIYSLLRPADSSAVIAPKLDEFEATGAELLITANPGCQMQWQAELRARGSKAVVSHIAEVLARAIDGADQAAGRGGA